MHGSCTVHGAQLHELVHSGTVHPRTQVTILPFLFYALSGLLYAIHFAQRGPATGQTASALLAAGAVALAAPAVVRAQAGPKIRIGYWPIAAGLPL